MVTTLQVKIRLLIVSIICIICDVCNKSLKCSIPLPNDFPGWEKKNLHDSYAMNIYGNVPGKIAEDTLVGHIPGEILHLCSFFY